MTAGFPVEIIQLEGSKKKLAETTSHCEGIDAPCRRGQSEIYARLLFPSLSPNQRVVPTHERM